MQEKRSVRLVADKKKGQKNLFIGEKTGRKRLPVVKQDFVWPDKLQYTKKKLKIADSPRLVCLVHERDYQSD